MPAIRIEMLGVWRAILPNGAVVDLPRHQPGVVLAYLALHPDREVTREELQTLLWPDEDPEVTRVRLRQHIAALKKYLSEPPFNAPDLLSASRPALRLLGISTDLADFEAALASARRYPAERHAHLTRALDLYRGELLPGFLAEPIIERRMYLESQAEEAETQRKQLPAA